MSATSWKTSLTAGWLALATAIPVGAHEDLTLTSWSGPYLRSQMLAFVRPFEAATDKKVNVEFYNGGLDEVRRQVRSANVKWDVVDFLEEDLIRACEEGLLEPVEPAMLAPAADGTPAEQDFIDNGLRPCGVGTMAWATAIGFNPDAFAGEKPATLADFFDIRRFPGLRGLQRDARIVMEWALLVDGVAADEVYEVLATDEGVDRTLAIMDPIKPYLVWWEEGNDPIDMLADGRVAITSIWGGEMTDAILNRDHSITPIWDGLVLKLDHFGIVKDSPNLDTAREFIRFATTTRQLADQVRLIYHSPARRSSMVLIGDKIRPYLPTAPEHMQSAIENDAGFWADHHERLQQRFRDWLEIPLQKGITGAPR
jgi:putative spermidine/putrescine transport system substrate-binding protein